MLNCRGRPVWRKLFLGKSDKDEQEKGIGGNYILFAQARPEELATSLPPATKQLQETFVVLFARNIDDVRNAHMFVVDLQDYEALVQTWRRVCPIYAEIPLEEERTLQLPGNVVPEHLLACAQHIAKTEKVCIASVGPAPRPIDLACDAHGAANPDAEHDADYEDSEQLGDGNLEAAKTTDAARKHQAFDTNTAEEVFASGNHIRNPMGETI